ncbi:hypothetical protein GGS23DRAFT_84619 [Durotheca rogersii]|uniref:uncharacterized protein n=1 Tax=Durotheca rogersii TaxID=419775 RepID=UPI00221FEF99|nr:uncharacterized protein GGS23DRAFT_84619 [Durotheca rogersii]KAI5862617.1 hypothetical protein GGS23DRAFT_84619 [Durotheca rogersii]
MGCGNSTLGWVRRQQLFHVSRLGPLSIPRRRGRGGGDRREQGRRLREGRENKGSLLSRKRESRSPTPSPSSTRPWSLAPVTAEIPRRVHVLHNGCDTTYSTGPLCLLAATITKVPRQNSGCDPWSGDWFYYGRIGHGLLCVDQCRSRAGAKESASSRNAVAVSYPRYWWFRTRIPTHTHTHAYIHTHRGTHARAPWTRSS